MVNEKKRNEASQKLNWLLFKMANRGRRERRRARDHLFGWKKKRKKEERKREAK